MMIAGPTVISVEGVQGAVRLLPYWKAIDQDQAEDDVWTPQSFAPGSKKNGVVKLVLTYKNTHSYSGENEGRIHL